MARACRSIVGDSKQRVDLPRLLADVASAKKQLLDLIKFTGRGLGVRTFQRGVIEEAQVRPAGPGKGGGVADQERPVDLSKPQRKGDDREVRAREGRAYHDGGDGILFFGGGGGEGCRGAEQGGRAQAHGRGHVCFREEE